MNNATVFAVLTDGEDLWTIGGKPHRFCTFDAAQRELDAHLRHMDEDGVDYEPAEFRIVEVKA